MTRRLSLSHQTKYVYGRPVPYGLQQVRLTPKAGQGQKVHRWEMDVQGGRIQAKFEDQHNNHVLLISTDADTQEITVQCSGEIELDDESGIVGLHRGPLPLWFFLRSSDLTKPGPSIRALVKQLDTALEEDIPKLHALSALISESVSYNKGETDAQTSAEAAMSAGKGVCQDHAHIFVSAARLLGYPARYVSGYMLMHDRTDQEAGHAWAEAHVPHLGWVGFDISNQKSPDDDHIRVATGLDYTEAAPISGLVMGGNIESLTVSLQVQQ